MKRVYHDYRLWECFKHGMWRTVSDKNEYQTLLDNAIIFTGNHILYGEYMQKVSSLWFYSCEHNLTDPSLNKRAWIGHAACCLAIGSPEQITRRAWWLLSEEQRTLADNEADIAIALWYEKRNPQLRLF